MAKKKVKKSSSGLNAKQKGWGGFSQFQLIVIFSVFIVFMIFFLM